MNDPIQHLLDEHHDIMLQVADPRRAVEDLGRRGETALPEALPVLGAVGRMMAGQLLQHARKEDEALFPALEEIFGREGSPTGVMRREHADIHAQAARFRETLHELNQIEHPAIVAHGRSLRELAAGGAGAEALRATGAEIVRLLDLHFAKEEQVLFPMAREMLSPEAMEAVMRQMRALEGSKAG